MKLPFLKFFPRDWLSDPSLRGCSNSAKGLWIDLICVMWECPNRGFLAVSSGIPMTVNQIAKATGNCDVSEVSALLDELEEAGVFCRTEDGIIYSNRMSRDEHKRSLCTEAGKRGGNPTLKGGLAKNSQSTLKPRYQMSDVRCQIEEESPSGDLSKPAPKVTPEDLLAAYEESNQKLPSVRQLTEQRKRHCRARLAEKPESFLADFVQAVKKAQGSSFLCGLKQGSSWKANFDWFIENETNVVKVLEGKYDDSANGNGNGNGSAGSGPGADRRTLEERLREERRQFLRTAPRGSSGRLSNGEIVYCPKQGPIDGRDDALPFGAVAPVHLV